MNLYANVSEADFVKWQKDRRELEDLISDMIVKVAELQSEVNYWQNQAMRNGNRD